MNEYWKHEQDRQTGIWFVTHLFRYSFIIWILTYGEPDLLSAIINLLNRIH